jgi:hypothetical protein
MKRGPSGTFAGKEIFMHGFYGKKLSDRNNLEDPDMNGRKLLKWM